MGKKGSLSVCMLPVVESPSTRAFAMLPLAFPIRFLNLSQLAPIYELLQQDLVP
jgi:hypothetical protein